jgi:uncharacterized protein involved in outer membrane biogenesis
MKFLFKWLFRLFCLAVVLAVIGLLSFDSILRVIMEHRLRARTGMDAEIGRVSFFWFKPQIEIRDLKLFNPPDYAGTPFLDIPEIFAAYDRQALTRSRLHLTLVRFNLGELDIVKNEAGRTNVFSLGLDLPFAQPGRPGPGGAPGLAEFHRRTGLSFEGIDVLNVSIGTLKFIDLKDRSHNRTQKIGIDNFVKKDVKTPSDLLGLEVLIGLRSGDFFTSLLEEKPPAGAPGLWKLLF